ncbi:signal peptidase I [Mangrovactinospora gilvigrisea]|uniref:Signal peptidase I n=1 Tax=Mangrovactinospora gilvigrisea TaxID=1428644 RepID=A0A1J7C5A3_9ACTN|nr:signal peptidase I [Mangrovactinospora gilvigrisea]
MLIGVGIVAMLGGFGMLALNYRPFAVPTDSMKPTVQPGDRVLADRVPGTSARRGDVVVIKDPTWGALPEVKRVVGVGGDRVSCCNKQGLLTVDGKPLKETYLAPRPLGDRTAHQQSALSKFAVTVPSGRLFLLGDNRLNSMDSAARLGDGKHGTVPVDAVVGRVEAVAWPSDRIGLLGGDRAGRAVFAAAGVPGAAKDAGGGAGPLVPALAVCVGGVALLLLTTLAGGVTAIAARSRERRGA